MGTRSAAILLFVLGCAPEGVADAGRINADTDPNCHWDCFLSVSCGDGVVRGVINAPVPCSAWTGSCPTRVLGTCAAGCRDRPLTDAFRWESWCAGPEERFAGDPCASDADCQPPAMVLDGGARPRLGCDLDLGMCEEVPAPIPSDFAGPCSASLDAFSRSDTSAHGVVVDPTCESGWCGFVAHEPPECDLHGCAITCANDGDCPPTMRCEERGNWTGRTLAEGHGGFVRVCDEPTESWLTCH
jgi:hypothetical protein